MLLVSSRSSGAAGALAPAGSLAPGQPPPVLRVCSAREPRGRPTRALAADCLPPHPLLAQLPAPSTQRRGQTASFRPFPASSSANHRSCFPPSILTPDARHARHPQVHVTRMRTSSARHPQAHVHSARLGGPAELLARGPVTTTPVKQAPADFPPAARLAHLSGTFLASSQSFSGSESVPFVCSVSTRLRGGSARRLGNPGPRV